MSLFKELKRRNVIRVAVAYLVIGWLLAQISGTLEQALNLPDWFDTMVVTLLLLGFPFTLFFSWAFEITTEGIKRERDIIRDDSISHITAKKLDLITIIALIAVAGLVLWQQMQSKPLTETSSTIENTAILDLNSIAVLPFANRSSQEGDLYFTDGIHDDILTQLAKIKVLKVISRTSVMQYRKSKKTISEIAKDLGVSLILEGGVQRAGNRIRINAQLIEVTADEHLWAETYDREISIENLFDIQSEITKHIVTAIKGQLSHQEQTLLSSRPTDSLAAWELLSQAKAKLRGSGYNSNKYLQALDYAEQATQQDPQFVNAWVLLATVQSSIYWVGYDPSESRQKLALKALNKAISIAPNSAEVLAAQGEYYYRIEHDYNKALNYQQQAYILMPNNPEMLLTLGLTQRRLGLWKRSVDNLTKASQLDPGDINKISSLAETLEMLGEIKNLESLLANSLKRFQNSSDLGSIAVEFQIWAYGDLSKARQIYTGLKPNSGDAYVGTTLNLSWLERDPKAVIDAFQRKEVLTFFESYTGLGEVELAQAYQLLGQEKEKESYLQKVIDLLTPINHKQNIFNVAVDLTTLAVAHALSGHNEKAIALANEAIQIFPLEKDVLDASPIHMAACYAIALTGDYDRALEMIALLLKTPGGFKRWYLYLDPHWDFFRVDERFNQLIKPLNFEQSIHAEKPKRQLPKL